MVVTKWWCLLFFLLCDYCAGWLNERPVLESIGGNLYISSAKDKNITFKTLGGGNIYINDINLLRTSYAAQKASQLVEKWKSGVLEDVETTLQRLTRIVEGPDGLIRKLSSIEFSGDSTVNASIVRPSTEIENNALTVRVRAITNRLRRLENKVRTISSKLRTNECTSDPCQNGGTCIDSYDSFRCQCPPEWEGTLCTVDVNECERLAGKPTGCQNGAACVNLPGSFSCTCSSGWHGFHCSAQKLACDQSTNAELCGNGYCISTNSPLGYTCICKPGWDHLNENDPSCRKDIDECTTSRYPCSVNPLVSCHNVPGTFYCGVCPAGYTGDGFKCQDIDECLVNNGGCSTTPIVECINTLGSRKCGACPNGYQGDGITCFYVGSCNINNGGCHSLATCREGPSSQTLCLCPAGYQGSGKGPRGCLPAENACRSNPCIHGTCHAQGTDGFTCTCNDGYTGPTCNFPTNPCNPNPCQNDGVCRRMLITGRRYCECTSSFSGPTCATPKQSCGGFFRNFAGSVEFPVGVGNKYDHGLSCAWVILTNHTMVLNLTFTRFALEESHGSDECKHDYVQIHDGRSAGSHIFGRYCGNKLPNNGSIISTHNSLYIWFHSDNTINSDGFVFNWTSIEPVCGGDVNEDYGSITSPGFPGKYPTNRDCFWNIQASPGKRIIMHFISLMLEEHPTCEYDYLEINETNYIGSHQLGLFCNHSKPLPITTSGSSATIHFHSDNLGTDTGFHLSFISIPGAPDCGGIFTSESGSITSPGYHTGSYSPDLTCDWEIQLPESSRIRLQWVHLEIERSRNCMFDAVRIYEGPNDNSPLVGKYCGSTIPPPISINSNRVLIRFETDSNFEKTGFVLKYEIECGGTFTEPSGILKSPFYPHHYPASKDCIYLISQPPGKAIMLTLEFMDIEAGSSDGNQTDCYFDRLEIRDGDTQNATLLTTLCGDEHSMPTEPIYSTHNYMLLEFLTDAYIHNNGFKANYTTIDRACGGIFKSAPGTINFPAGPLESNCIFTIRAPPKHVIQLNWISFPTRRTTLTEECLKSRVVIEVIENYGSVESVTLGKYCPIKAPPQIMTTQGNDLTLIYHDPEETFDINYQANFIFLNDSHSCGGHYYADVGTIRSPNYPEKYPKNKECIWIIEAKNRFLVTLNFNDFELENSSKCGYDYLEIRSGSQQNSPLLGKFCGSQNGSRIKSMTNQMYIKFVSDSSLQKKGFELKWHTLKSGCGGNLRASSGAIISPNYPQNYYHRATCTWNIRVSAGSAIRLTFVDFDLEDHVKCVFDYLEISDVFDGYSRNTQRFCGTNIPSIIVSKSNQIKLTFRSDVLTNSRGFHLRYVTDCHNKVTGFQGVIESPNFPQNYDSQSNCSWIISVPPGNTINMTFSHFNIRGASDSNCKKDYVLIKEGDDDESNTELARKCGLEEDVLPLKISTTQRQAFVTFISGRFGMFSGFRLEWYTNGCSKHFTKPIGQIQSPGYPDGNKLQHPEVECEWLIDVSYDKSIEITFTKIDTLRSRSCSHDSTGAIKIYNGVDENAPLLVDSLCYSKTPVTYTSTGHQMLIKYSSQAIYASHGFSSIYHSVDLKCGGKFTGHSGVIYSPNYPKNYPHSQNCEWLITVDKYHTVNLTFLELDLERSRNCSDDYIKVIDGNSTEAPALGIHCHSHDGLPYYVSTGHQILVVMRTDSLVSAKGFKAEYNRTCGARIVVDSDGILRSSPTLNTLEGNCSWILTAQEPDDKVILSFTHIDLNEDSDCTGNHIQVYEGEGINGSMIGQICTNKIPAPFYSTGNTLTVHLSALYVQNVGDTFDAIYSTFSNACGGKYLTESGIITSQNYPQSYPNSADCIWILDTAPGNTIQLVFTDFDVLSSENCDIDYVEVREKDGIGKLRGVFCGKDTETITSSQPLWIRFKTGINTAGNPKGFRAEYNLLRVNIVTGDQGEIASPTYPHPYRKGDTYSWQITVGFNYFVKIEFIDLNLDHYEDYCYSSLKIYDGVDDYAPEIKEICGLSVPSESITSSSNLMYIEMENSQDPVGNWFRLKWTKVPRITNEVDSQEIDTSKNNELIILTEKNNSVSISSPGEPNGYDANLKLTWTIVSPVGTHLRLRFTTLDLEETDDCIADYVAIYKGYAETIGSKENLLHRVCHSNETSGNYPGTNVMTVQFVTDYYGNETGFHALIMTECGGLIEQSNGVIEVKDPMLHGKVLPYIYSCEWVVKVRPGRRISVKVVENSLITSERTTSDNSCRNNFIMLKNGESASSPLLGSGKYCNSTIPPVQNTTSNYLYVKLSVAYASVDFKLIFRELAHDCGGRFQLSANADSQEEISSPNYPNIPAPHTECTWTFMSIDEHRLTIHFLDRFDLGYSKDCEKEYVEIRDGGTDMSPLLGRFCRNTAPSSISTKGNLMFVRYLTDNPEPRNGFKALITNGEVCGGIQRESRGGVITSPNYPDSYGLVKDNFCSWWIIAPASNRGLRITFEDFDLPYRMNCSTSDNVKIYEKSPGNFNNTEIGTYCGKNKPGPIDILTNEAVIIFESSYSNARLRGFKLNYTFDNACGGSINAMNGEIKSTGYPRITGHKFCNWKITTKEGYQVVLRIEDLDLGGDKYTSGSYISFYHDLNTAALIAQWRDTTKSTIISSSSNTMNIYYISSGGHRGLKASFTSKPPAPCGALLTDWEGTISSPQIAPFNTSTYYCKWIVRQPEDLEPTDKTSLTLSMTFTGDMFVGKARVDCGSYNSNILIKGEETLGKLCGNFTEEPVTILSPYRTHSIEASNTTTSYRTKANFTAVYKWHKCGGILTGPSHVIQVPKNVTYPVYCAWKVKYPSYADTILTTFAKMNLPCGKSYLRVKGRTFRSPILGKFCGNEIPHSIVSPTNEIMIEYYAAEASGDFEIHLEPSNYACGGKVRGRRTAIMSPGFPENYPNNTECIWEIIANNGYHIGLTFTERFNLETSKNCQNDYVEIFEWKDEAVNNTNWNSLGRVCGRNPPEKSFNTTNDRMLVKFVSNDKIEGEGFKAVWHSNCGGVYNVTEIPKYIKSPNYGLNYPANSFCNYTLIAPEDKDIIIDFISFNVEGMDTSCFDNVTIMMYSGDWLRGESVFCGKKNPPRRMARGRMEIIFRSDSTLSRTGFKLKYFLNDCGGTIKAPRMLMPMVDNDPESYTFVDCTWLIQAPPKKSVLLRFEQFNISQALGSCIANGINIYEGNSTDVANKKGTFCGDLNEHLPVLQSVSNMMTISFHAGSYGSKDNVLKAAIFFVNGPETGCGGNLHVNKSRTFKTQFDEYYEPLQDCHWTISAPPGYTIQFTIQEIDLKNTTYNATALNERKACQSDYLEVRDGGPYAELIGHFCGDKVPPPITSTSNLLWIRFISDGVNQGRGVKGTLTSVTSPCGVTELTVDGNTKILTSPNYPDTYQSEISCRWTIHATGTGSLQRIRITFDDFQLEDSERCENEYLQIADMDSRSVISEGFGEQLVVTGSKNRQTDIVIASHSPQSFYKYCGTNTTHDYYSNYKNVEIIYKAKRPNIGQRKGFKLEYSKSTCSRNYTALQGRIVHDDITECWLTIEVPKNYTISLYFNNLFLPGSTDCSTAYMQIREGGFDGHVIQTVCSYATPNPVFSKTNRLSIHVLGNKLLKGYHSNGYDMTYTSSKVRGCGGRLYNYGGVFSSPFYPEPYRNHSVCIWDLNVPRGMKLSLTFDTFDIGQKNMCDTDYLYIAELLEDDVEDIKVTYCGGDTPADYHSQNNRVIVMYSTTVNNGGTGWLAHFAAY